MEIFYSTLNVDWLACSGLTRVAEKHNLMVCYWTDIFIEFLVTMQADKK